MNKRRLWSGTGLLLMAALIVFGNVPTVLANESTSSSANYQVTESQFGSSSNLESCSEQYCARASIGDLATGTSTNGTSSAAFGSITPDEPMLEVIVDPGESDLGVLTTEKTATKTAIVRVRNYLSDGYILQVVGNPPKYNDHTLRTPSSLEESEPGTEQFAINAVANTSPDVGSNPVQVPSNQTSFGVVNSGYNTPNQFRYVSGNIIAHSLKESGRTDYTISMIVNISNTTPAGHYTGDFSAIAVPVY